MSSSPPPLSLSPRSPTFDSTPPRATLPRSQPPRQQSAPGLPAKTSVPMATTVSLPPAIPPAPYTQTTSSASTTTSTSSSFFRPTTGPSSSSTFAGPSRPLSPPQTGKRGRPLTSGSAGVGSSSSVAAAPMSLGGSAGINQATSASTASVSASISAAAAQLPPVTGVAKMAVAAKRGATGSDGLPRSRRGSQAVPIEEEDHPLSDKCLKAR